MKELQKIIIGPLTEPQFKHVTNHIKGLGYVLNLHGKLKTFQDDIGIKIGDKMNYCLNFFDQYKHFAETSKSNYDDHKIYSYDEYNKLIHPPKLPQENVVAAKEVIEKIIGKTPKKIELTEENIRYTYEHTTLELKNFLKMLFGKEMFEDKLFKIGDIFEYCNKEFRIIKTGQTVISMIDLQSFENFCKSQIVNNPYCITENELKNLLGIYYEQFKLKTKN